jgi:hypothetical protein
MVTKPTCKDCAVDGLPLSRKAPYPGPRCATHHRSRIRLNRETAKGRRLVSTYGITAEDYAALLAVQNGVCFICQRAKGFRKALSVDHDHAVAILDGHAEEAGCPNCVRGLLCQPCNRMLGHLRDEPEAFERAADYLRNWPSKR